jgi:glycosyltransferase involved in cell wall biosynthesis
MFPHLDDFVNHESGIKRVVEHYTRYLPDFGVEVVAKDSQDYDILAAHAGITRGKVSVCHLHGLYWSGDYNASGWEYSANADIVEALRSAKQVTVPSRWVAETIERDMRFSPHVIGHGINVDEWYPQKHERYVLWNKNRRADVCDPTPMMLLARSRPNIEFVTTYLPQGWVEPLRNVRGIGLVDHGIMRRYVQRAMVYLSTTKETFGIGVLEAMASGVPVLGFDWGGNRELITHGETGYLAKVNNLQDLATGLDYCIKHRDTLGANARESAKQWTWQSAVEKVAEVYQLAMEEHPFAGETSIIIPAHNYANVLERAVKSAVNQSRKPIEVIVVDDRSTDNTEEIALTLNKSFDVVKYVKVDYGNVALTRNHGIEMARGEFVCCLDADDQIDPRFLEACVPELRKDRSLGIVYTGLWAIKPDGSEGLSTWPTQVDYDKQLTPRGQDNLRGLNQIPTCCVFRKEAWERTGGYKARYAPLSAGAEDAELWARIMSIGYGAKKVTDAGLFIYSWQTGRVSGDTSTPASLREPFWLGMHPWAIDKQHPFASRATPLKNANNQQLPSHPVRQYDQPTISVVIPVGPGHEKVVEDALDSLESQTFRRWEAIVIWDGTVASTHFNEAYPYARIHGDANKSHGAGWARNRGAEVARAPFLVFLDADDTLAPTALEKMLLAWQDYNGIIYTDYYNSIITSKEDLLENFEPDTIAQYIEPQQKALIVGHSADYDCVKAQQNPVRNLYHWCLVTCLIPKVWHDTIGGFDESMESFEDVLYHWTMARYGYCYRRIPEPLVVYRLYTGGRRELASLQNEEGRGVARNMLKYSESVLERIEMAGCSKCPGKGPSSSPVSVNISQQMSQLSIEQQRMQDKDFVMSEYTHPNRGNHKVTGAVTRIDYGYRGGGERFLVHRADMEAQPQYFREMQRQPLAPVVDSGELPAPKPLAPPMVHSEPQVEEDLVQIDPDSGEIPEYIAPKVASSQPEPEPEAVVNVVNVTISQPEAVVEEIVETGAEEVETVTESTVVGLNDTEIDLNALPGITMQIANELQLQGLNTKAKILSVGVEGLQKIKGIGEVRAQAIIEALSIDARSLS